MTTAGETAETSASETARASADRSLRPADLPARYRHDWALFIDWCAATDTAALPAAPATLAEFLAEHPATPATQRRRMSAINHAHTLCGLPAPGRSEPIREILDARRAARLAALRHRADEVMALLPASGWPCGLFGRRDAALLALAAAGMSYAAIAGLRRRDLTALNVGGSTVTTARLPAPLPDDGVAALHRWAAVLEFVDTHPSTHALAGRLHRAALPDAVAHLRSPGAPVFTRIDRWGYLPLAPQPLTAAAIGMIVRAHLTGTAPGHAPPPREPAADRPRPATGTAIAEPVRLGAYFDRGIAARRRDHTRLAGLDALIDDIGTQADEILERTLAILDEEAATTGRAQHTSDIRAADF
ncbi:hypothetical protein [Tomitella gaofuii]|uniref:hypothetical protein n=1 Tax=Tomitella gaofuii TaxID=2760083 RepID=UPI001F26BAFF|nr:hypothetical protein [Tomitella gaofuii]